MMMRNDSAPWTLEMDSAARKKHASHEKRLHDISQALLEGSRFQPLKLDEVKQSCGRFREHDASRCRIRNPCFDPLDALRIGDGAFVTDEWPIGRPHQLRGSTDVEQRIDIR